METGEIKHDQDHLSASSNWLQQCKRQKVWPERIKDFQSASESRTSRLRILDRQTPMYLSPNSAMRSNRKNHMTWQMKRIQTKTGSEWN